MNKIYQYEESALVLTVPEVEHLIGSFREKYTVDGEKGMPAHITILYPFLKFEKWNEKNILTIQKTISGISSFSFQLTQLNHFEDHYVLFLEPSPVNQILSVIKKIYEKFPEFPPYSGEIPLDELKPHLTVAIASSATEMTHLKNHVSEAISPFLPMNVLVEEVALAVKFSDKWEIAARFSLGND